MSGSTTSRPTISRCMACLAVAVAIPLVGVTAAACGGSGSAATAATLNTPRDASAIVGVSKSSLGSILVNSTRRTLYLFKADVGMQSACTDACVAKWPPLLATGRLTAGKGLSASRLGSITRSDGTRQITYNGHPLYLFVKDEKPGDVKGQGVIAFGAAWFALSPSGSQISGAAPSTPSY